jgi:glycosyltransferase involved in cell wall biosynthesis
MRMTHHIGIDSRLTFYRTGGISTYIRGLIGALALLDTSNTYTVFESRKARGSDVTRFAHAPLWTPAHHRIERLALSLELARFRLDLLHNPDFIPPLRGARRHIITVHDLTFLRYPQYLTADARNYYNRNIAAAVRHADHILADSQATKDDLRDILAVPEDKVTVHMLGVDLDFRRPSADVLAQNKDELRLPDNYILFVGTFEPRKNIVGLLTSYRALTTRMPDAPPLVLAGTRGWLFDETMAQIESLRLGDRVLWRENIAQAMLPALYALARVLVLPSFYEGFGLPALEAMACGTPPIVSNRSSLPEVVGDVGLQINPDDPHELSDALERAITDDAWRAQERDKGIRRAATFTWENTARVTLSAYESLLSCAS